MENLPYTPKFGLYRLLFITMTIFVMLTLINGFYICDDALISFAIAENLVQGHGPNYNIQERVQVFTNPLWTFTLALLRLFTGEYHFSSMILSLTLVGFIFALSRSLFRKIITSTLLVLSFLCSKAIYAFTGSGLEVPMSMALIFTTIYVLYKGPAKSKIFWVTFVASLGVVNRLDLSLLLFPLSLVSLWQEREIPYVLRLRQFLLGGTPVIGWLSFSLFYYGSIFPNTYYAKVAGLNFDDWQQLMSGLGYFRAAIERDQFSLLIIFLSFFLLLQDKQRGAKEWGIAIGISLSLGYILKTGGDHMFPRFLVTPTFAALILVLLQLEKYNLSGHSLAADFGILGFALFIGNANPYTPLRMLMMADQQKQLSINTKINNFSLRDFQVFWWNRRLNGYAARNTYPPGNEEKSAYSIQGTAGKITFYYGPGMHNIDPYSLADPLLSKLTQHRSTFAPDHNPRALPTGYIESLVLGKNLITDPHLHEYYEKVRIITRSSLFSFERIRTIMKMNLGFYKPLLQQYDAQTGIFNHEKYIQDVHVIAGYDLTYCRKKFQNFRLICAQPARRTSLSKERYR